MADSFKVLAQVIPSAGVLTDAYTVPGVTSDVISSISICNQGGVPSTFRLSIAVAGAVDSSKQYLYFDTPLDGNSTFIATVGITLATTDVVRVQSGNGQISFNVFGAEIT